MPKKHRISWPGSLSCAACALCAGSIAANAQEITAHTALASDYVYRGISKSDNGAAFQLGIDLSSDLGLFGGVWASTADIATGGRNRPREVNFYVGYVHYFENDLSASLSLNRYSYPGSTGNVRYDYNEWTVSVGFKDSVWLEFDYADSLFDHDGAAHNVEILANWPLLYNFQLEAGIGYFDVSNFAESAYTYWQVGVSRPLGWATFDLRFHDTSNAPLRISAGDLADPRIVVAISAAF